MHLLQSTVYLKFLKINSISYWSTGTVIWKKVPFYVYSPLFSQQVIKATFMICFLILPKKVVSVLSFASQSISGERIIPTPVFWVPALSEPLRAFPICSFFPSLTQFLCQRSDSGYRHTHSVCVYLEWSWRWEETSFDTLCLSSFSIFSLSGTSSSTICNTFLW